MAMLISNPTTPSTASASLWPETRSEGPLRADREHHDPGCLSLPAQPLETGADGVADD